MGYDLHITRAKLWTDDAHPIALAEWAAYVSGDPELDMTGVAETPTPDGILRYENPGLAVWRSPESGQVWFDLRHGNVVVKNPDDATIEKMVAVARRLNAHVQGDEGETYSGGGRRPVPAPGPSFLERFRSWLQYRKPSGGGDAAPLPFTVGDRVRDVFGALGTVTSIDREANHGLGSIGVHFDDGRELTYAAVAHGLERA
jgi:hypothetical protein